MKRIKVKVKEKTPDLKGVNICDTIYKEFAEDVKKYGKTQYFYKHHYFEYNETFFVGVIEYGNKNYFLVERNGKVISCIEM